MVILPATPSIGVAATAAGSVTVTGGGTNLASTTGTGTSAGNGVNGAHKLDVTGTVATQGYIRGKGGLTSGMSISAILDATNTVIAVETSANPQLQAGTGTHGASFTQISGLGLTTATVGDVITKINSQVTSVTAYLDSGFIFIKANKVGDYTLSVVSTSTETTNTSIDGTASLAAKLFGPGAGTPGYDAVYPPQTSRFMGIQSYGTKVIRGASYGFNPYGSSVAWAGTDTFIGSTLTSYVVDGGVTFGHMNAGFSPAVFEATVETATGFYTAVHFAAGYDLVLTTGSSATGIQPGTASIAVSGGTRDTALTKPSLEASAGRDPLIAVPSPASWVGTLAAGVTTQVVVSLNPTASVGTASIDETHVIEAASFTAPAGFVISSGVAAQAQVNHDDLSGREVASATISGQNVSVYNFSMTPTESLSVTITITAATVKGVYQWAATYTEMGASTAQTVVAQRDVEDATSPFSPAQSFHTTTTVWPLYAVSSIAFTQPDGYYARAGTTVTVFARALDRYNNAVGQYWPTHKVRFDVTTDYTTQTTSTIGVDGASQMLQYGFKMPATAGTSTIRAFLPGEATTSVNVISVGVGAPAAMVLSSAKNPNTNAATAGSYSPIQTTFTVSFRDANGKPSGFLPTEPPRIRGIKVFYGSAGVSNTVVTRASDDASLTGTAQVGQAYASSSEVTFTLNGYPGESWNMWAADYQVGQMSQSNVLTQDFGAAIGTTVVSTAISVTVSPVTLVGSSTAGYAAADGLHPVTFTVRGVAGHTISLVATNASPGFTDTLMPGSASATSAVVPTSGAVTFNILSTFPSMNGTSRAWKNWQISDDTSGTTAVPPILAQTHFYAPTISSMVPDKTHVLANNTDVAVYTATVRDPIGSAPVVGTTIWFSKTATSAGTLSSTSATTNASGVAQVSIKSSSAGTATVSARDFTGTNEVTAAVVTFDEYQAQPSTSATITAQRSARGPRPSFGIKLVDNTGAAVNLNQAEITSIIGTITSTTGRMETDITTSVANNIISITCTLPGTTVASTTPVQLVISGRAWVTDALGSASVKTFQGIINVTVVDNSTATGSGSNLAAGGTLTGTGFRAPSATATDSCNVELKWGSSWLTIGTVVVGADGNLRQPVFDCRGIVAGTYDMRIDGITFTQAFTVSSALSQVPVGMTLYRDPMSSAYVAPGASVVLRGAITDGVNGARLAKNVVLQSAAVGSDTWTTIDMVDTDTNGLYAFTVNPTVGTQYRASFAGDAGYAAGNSAAVTINVKTAVSLSTPSAPLAVTRAVAFTTRGTVSASAPYVRVYVYRYYNGAYRYVRFYTATKSGTAYSARIALPYAGRYRIRAYAPAGATTLAKYSSYRYVTAR